MNESLSLAERGVYLLPWYGAGGERFLAAVDRRGRRIAEATVVADVDPRPVERMLWEFLDREDPAEGAPGSPPRCGLSVVR